MITLLICLIALVCCLFLIASIWGAYAHRTQEQRNNWKQYCPHTHYTQRLDDRGIFYIHRCNDCGVEEVTFKQQPDWK